MHYWFPLLCLGMLTSTGPAHHTGGGRASFAVTNAQEEPQGLISKHSYQSEAIGGPLEYYVYTPPEYDAKRRQPYPVMYLLHGGGGDARSWISEGGANTTLDRLISEGVARPMILVMPSLGVVRGSVNVTNFSKALLGEIIPRVEATYHASSDRLARAVAGLSVGAAHALVIGLNHLDRFAWIGGFSPSISPLSKGPSTPWNLPSLDSSVNRRIKLIYVTCGTADSLIANARRFRDYLVATGVRVSFVEFPDAAHDWTLWSRNLADLTRLLFQESN